MTRASPQELLTRNGITLNDYRAGRYYTVCPQCSAARSTKAKREARCLGVTIEADGRVRWGCSHCSWRGPSRGDGAAVKANGKHPDELTSFIYRDADGIVRFRKVRNRSGRLPRFWLEHPDKRGAWTKGTKDVDTAILYRADEVAQAIADGRVILIVEGERDADGLWSLGFAATTSAHGASEVGKRSKWTKRHSEQLRGSDIIILNDNDGPGYQHADTTAVLSLGIATRVRRLDLAMHWPDMPKGADISDWLALGHTADELTALIDAAPDYVAAQDEATQNDTAPSDTAQHEAAAQEADDADAEIERLAKLSPLQYEQGAQGRRQEARHPLPSMLDNLVNAERAELGLDGDDDRHAGQRHRVSRARAVARAGGWGGVAQRDGGSDPQARGHVQHVKPRGGAVGPA